MNPPALISTMSKSEMAFVMEMLSHGSSLKSMAALFNITVITLASNLWLARKYGFLAWERARQ